MHKFDIYKIDSMKRFLLYSLGLGLLAAISSCGGDDPLPAAVPSFEATTEFDVFEIAQPIQFINNSTNAANYRWNFGDGGTSTEVNPKYSYEEHGDYVVTLTAFTEDEQSDSVSINLDVGQRELIALGVLAIDFNNRDALGNIEGPWDTGSGPDIVMIFGPEDDASFESTIITPVVADVAEPFVPFAFTLNDPLPLTDDVWTLALIDDDTEIEAGALDLMIQTSNFNPIINSITFIDADTGEGRISITGSGFDLFLDFDIN